MQTLSQLINSIPENIEDDPGIGLRVPYAPHPGQVRFHNSRARFRVLACGARWGKDRASVNELNKTITRLAEDPTRDQRLIPRIHCWLVAPNFPLSKQLWRELLFFTPPELIESINKTERTITWKPQYGGAVIEIKSADNPDELVSVGLDVVVITECGLVAQSTWEDSLRPRLSSPGRAGLAILNGTPRGMYIAPNEKHWFYVAFLNGKDPSKPEWESWNFPTWSNPYISKEEIALMKRDMEPRLYDQNIGGLFLNIAWGESPFSNAFNPEYNVVLWPFMPNRKAYRSWDFGQNYPACGIWQIDRDSIVRKLGEVHIFNIGTKKFAEEVKDYCNRYFNGAEFVDYCDVAGFAKQPSADHTDVEILNAMGVFPQALKIFDGEGIELLRSYLLPRPGDNKPGYTIHPRCRITIEGLSGAWHYGKKKRYESEFNEDTIAEVHPYIDFWDSEKYFWGNHFGAAGVIQKGPVANRIERAMKRNAPKRRIDPRTGLPVMVRRDAF